MGKERRDVEIPEGDYGRLIGARAEMEYWAEKGNTVAKIWVHHDSDEDATCYVTLAQMAAIVNRSKPTLRRLYDSGKLPTPSVEGIGGKPHEWPWDAVRPILEAEYGRPLPATFPADRFAAK